LPALRALLPQEDKMPDFYPAIGTAVALAGADKLAGDRAYAQMFRHLGWSRGDMVAAATAEVLGGLLMGPRVTRRLGGLLVGAASLAVLISELNHRDSKLAKPRSMVLMTALAAFFLPGRA
jgi:hypothetical protein